MSASQKSRNLIIKNCILNLLKLYLILILLKCLKS